MPDSLPYSNTLYNDSIFKIAAYKLIDQAPGIVSWALDIIVYKLSSNTKSAFFKEIFPTYQITLEKSEITIRYPEKKKVTYYWICQKLMQLLLWNEGSRVKSMGYLMDHCNISFNDINGNILKIQQIMSDYASHSTCKSMLSGFSNSSPVENSTLPSYQNVVSDRDIVGPSNAHLPPCAQKSGSFSETNGHSRELSANNSLAPFKLPYSFEGSDKLQARNFINDYDCLALRNKWSSEEKCEFFSNNLETNALEWYLCISPNRRSNWQDLKIEFMRKYCINNVNSDFTPYTPRPQHIYKM